MEKQTGNAGRPDFNAWFVLQGTLAAMHHLHYYGEGDNEILVLYELLARAASRTRVLPSIMYRLPYRWQYRVSEWVTHPGRLRHFYLRRKAIETYARALLDQGQVTQVIVLGAGLDVLALRLACEYPDLKFIEIDRKESHDFKRSALPSLPNNIEFIEGDLRHPLPTILADARVHDAGAKTLWIAEGLFMFMPKASVGAMLQQIRQLCATGSQVIFTTVPSAYQGKWLAQWIQIYVLWKEDCPYLWSVSLEKVPAFIEKLHYRLMAQISYEQLHKKCTLKKNKQNKRIGEDIHIVEVVQ